MVTKTISVMDDVYEKLKSKKLPGESFSEEIDRLLNKSDISHFFGAWKNIDKTKLTKIKRAIKSGRKDINK